MTDGRTAAEIMASAPGYAAIDLEPPSLRDIALEYFDYLKTGGEPIDELDEILKYYRRQEETEAFEEEYEERYPRRRSA
jgi:hypothetical protein